ncbi:MAG: hypothetical protein U0Q11_22130 [Vicinamibacterales bacterium]
MFVMRHFSKLAVLSALAVASASCGDVARSGRSPVYLVIDSITAVAGGSSSTTPAGFLQSDVLRLVTTPDPCTTTAPCPTIYNDTGTATFHLALKDIGSATTPTSPSSNNQVTITRYHVSYRRADGRNTQGVDVPYAFDGAGTLTVPIGNAASLGFELVRHVAKAESPLVQLVNNATIITTIADVTFYGQDLVGNEIQASGSIQVDFGNFGDR